MTSPWASTDVVGWIDIHPVNSTDARWLGEDGDTLAADLRRLAGYLPAAEDCCGDFISTARVSRPRRRLAHLAALEHELEARIAEVRRRLENG